jgi:hypothetical protein
MPRKRIGSKVDMGRAMYYYHWSASNGDADAQWNLTTIWSACHSPRSTARDSHSQPCVLRRMTLDGGGYIARSFPMEDEDRFRARRIVRGRFTFPNRETPDPRSVPRFLFVRRSRAVGISRAPKPSTLSGDKRPRTPFVHRNGPVHQLKSPDASGLKASTFKNIRFENSSYMLFVVYVF